MIIFCPCKHTYQDEKYGKQKRVHNSTQKEESGSKVYRCTVCGKEKTNK